MGGGEESIQIAAVPTSFFFFTTQALGSWGKLGLHLNVKRYSSRSGLGATSKRTQAKIEVCTG